MYLELLRNQRRKRNTTIIFI